MVIQNKKNKIKVAEKEFVDNKEEVYPSHEVVEKLPEKSENKKYEEMISAELRREIDLMEADPNLKKNAEIERQEIEFLGQKEKLEHLLKIAREKGLVNAIQIARNMNEPFLIDLLHDTLAKEGYFKDFMQKNNQTDDQT